MYNEYEASEVVEMGKAEKMILGVKVHPFPDDPGSALCLCEPHRSQTMTNYSRGEGFRRTRRTGNYKFRVHLTQCALNQ